MVDNVETHAPECPKCNNRNVTRKGKTKSEKQRHYCKECRKTFILKKTTYPKLSEDTIVEEWIRSGHNFSATAKRYRKYGITRYKLNKIISRNMDLVKYKHEYQKNAVATLKRNGYDINAAAADLGISKYKLLSTLKGTETQTLPQIAAMRLMHRDENEQK